MAEMVDIDQAFKDGKLIDEALAKAALSARREYVRLGRPMPAWENGRLVWIPPELLDVTDDHVGHQ